MRLGFDALLRQQFLEAVVWHRGAFFPLSNAALDFVAIGMATFSNFVAVVMALFSKKRREVGFSGKRAEQALKAVFA